MQEPAWWRTAGGYREFLTQLSQHEELTPHHWQDHNGCPHQLVSGQRPDPRLPLQVQQHTSTEAGNRPWKDGKRYQKGNPTVGDDAAPPRNLS